MAWVIEKDKTSILGIGRACALMVGRVISGLAVKGLSKANIRTAHLELRLPFAFHLLMHLFGHSCKYKMESIQGKIPLCFLQCLIFHGSYCTVESTRKISSK